MKNMYFSVIYTKLILFITIYTQTIVLSYLDAISTNYKQVFPKESKLILEKILNRICSFLRTTNLRFWQGLESREYNEYDQRLLIKCVETKLYHELYKHSNPRSKA